MTRLKKLHDAARHLVQTLTDAGYIAYFAGGAVRDLLLGCPIQEIDIATSAPPDVLMSLFPKTIPVGAQFGVVMVGIDSCFFEVATFRRDGGYVDGRHPVEVQYASAQEDAQRRDFTINGMFYDPLTEEVLDFVGGKNDLQRRILRAIGDPTLRFQEDRLRMIRAVRFATRFDLAIDPATGVAIRQQANSLFPAVSIERIAQEWTKIFQGPHPDQAVVFMQQLGLLEVLFPEITSLSEKALLERVAPFAFYPFGCPAVLYLHAIVPELGVSLCKQLKLSRKDEKLLEHFLALPKEPDPVTWVHYYAHPDSVLCLQVHAAAKGPDFLAFHQEQQEGWAEEIRRVREGKPLLTATFLQAKGIQAGPEMGILLQRGERLAIERRLQNPEEIWGILQKEASQNT